MKITIGALAHVDAGKTTLSEAILYKTNTLRKKGRVDNKDSFLDFNEIEKEKGITIFNKQGLFSYKDKEYIYIDTPGHNDLSYETNRAIAVLDCAILLISAIEDIPTDTIKKFDSLLNYNIPILIFVNKMDITNFDKQTILNNIKNKLSSDCIEYSQTDEFLSLSSDELLEKYINNNKIDNQIIVDNLKNNTFFPCFFGSALKEQGIDELLDYIDKYIVVDYKNDDKLNAYLYKISNNLSYIKVLSGSLNNKDTFGENKINEMYYVNGDNYTATPIALAGDIVAVKGLKDIPLGTYLPSFITNNENNVTSLTYRIISNLDSNDLFKKASEIINEFPELNIQINNNDIFINLNGELHSLLVKKIFKERINVDIDFSDPIIKYKETINDEVYGVGHFEPLRHYAEAVVKLSPNNIGIKVSSLIDNSYINSLLSYLRNYTLRGILTNSPLDNIEITIVDIKTHPKHTEGGDLLQSIKRAIRHALTKTQSILLEPLYLVAINTNDDSINTIISFLTSNTYAYTIKQNMIIAKIPLRKFNSSLTILRTKLKGQIDFNIENVVYEQCVDSEEIITKRNYDYRSDMRNPAGSIFCKNGAGHYVEPEDVESNMHLDMSNYTKKESKINISHNAIKISDEELNRVWNSLYKPKPRFIENKNKNIDSKYIKPINNKPLLYLIDGYNLMYFLDEDNAYENLLSARENIINLVCDFAGYVNAEVILVFDAYKTNSHHNEVLKNDNITIVYTKQKETADKYIELKSKELDKEYKVLVVTSDRLEQLKAFANDAITISSREFIARYNNIRKSASKLNEAPKFKPFEDLKKLLEED